jgi:hypothetical protein
MPAACEDLVTSDAARPPLLPSDPSQGQRRLTVATLGLLLVVLLSLAFWGWLWGVVGMILAVPLTVIAKIILENIRETRPLAILISNR